MNLNPFKSKIKYFQDNGKPQVLVRTGGAAAGGGIGTTERSIAQLRRYYDYYSGEGTIFASINSIAWNTVMVGYTLHSANDEAKELILRLCDRVNLMSVIKDATAYSLIFGDSFTEKINTKKSEITRLKAVDSRTMLINSDEYGDIVDYQQNIGGKLITPTLKPETIVHLRFFPIPGSPYGLSLLQPNMDTIDRKVATDESLFNAIQRHTAKYVVTVGSEKDGQVPPPEVMDDIKTEFEDIDSKMEFIVPWFIKIDTIDERGIQGVREYYDLFQTQLTVGLLCPEEALGLGKGSTEATARVKAILYERMIKSFQNELSIVLENQLFKPYLDVNGIDIEEPENWVKIKFNNVTEEDEALRAKWLGNLLRGFADGQIPFTRNEIRSFFDLEPIEGMDDIPTAAPEEEPGEEPEEETEEEEEPEEEKPEPEEEEEKKNE